ncbi:MAG TPA: NUDIX hydrolase [Xanthobacteraceae bacterium]|nr:NUDIX hydrolase [Xanthobacteraceae bacterium]
MWGLALTKILRVENKYKGWAKFLVAEVRLPDGTVLRREIEDHGAAVAVLPYDAARKTAILVRQFRAPVFYASGQEQMLEAIAGIQSEADAAVTARREAMEEAGLRLQALELVATVWTMPGISTERMSLYLAPYARADHLQEGGGNPAEHESIAVIEIGLHALDAMLQSGRLDDMKTIVLLQALKLRRGDLFK